MLQVITAGTEALHRQNERRERQDWWKRNKRTLLRRTTFHICFLHPFSLSTVSRISSLLPQRPGAPRRVEKPRRPARRYNSYYICCFAGQTWGHHNEARRLWRLGRNTTWSFQAIRTWQVRTQNRPNICDDSAHKYSCIPEGYLREGRVLVVGQSLPDSEASDRIGRLQGTPNRKK